jgi:uncharacterized pyridoxamine 5'-phosphate oxidase family protein
MKMEFLQGFNTIMTDTKDIALATAVNNVPNVRIMNFYYDTQKKGIIYFSTFKGSPKTLEFSQNNKVGFTTVPVGTIEHTRVTNAIVKKSDLNMAELKDALIKKYPGFEMVFAQGEDKMEIYEIHFKEADVILGFNQHGKVTL